MCACEPGFVCARCNATPFGDAVRDHEPLTIAEWDSLIASEQMATAEPFEGRS